MKQTRNAALVALFVLLATAGLAGQTRGGARDGSGPLVDTSALVVFQGTVVQLVAGLGQGLPELEITATDGQAMSFVLGPFWYLQASGFAAAPGDLAEVSAYACATCENGYAVATVVNQTQNLTLGLRAADGTPLWTSRGGQAPRQHVGRGGSPDASGNGGTGSNGNTGSNGQGPGTGDGKGNNGQGGCDACEPPDLGVVATFAGTVASFAATAGAGTPTVTLTTTAGDVAILLSPYSVLLRAGFEITVGLPLEITAAAVEHDGVEAWLALVVTDPATGLTVVLRDPSTGLPPVGRGRH